MKRTPRLRMFAGPNGSGKSTIKDVIPEALLGTYVNADEIEKELRTQGQLNLGGYRVACSQKDARAFFQQSSLIAKAGLTSELAKLRVSDNTLILDGIKIDSYVASVVADLIRQHLLDAKISFTFETVMSSPDKVEFLKKAKARGFRTYLYYVATEDPDINVSRVEARVKQGGHPVPKDKILSRYQRSLDLLADALQYADRAYIFDNSRQERIWVAEITDGCELEFKSAQVPHWFEVAVLEKLAN